MCPLVRNHRLIILMTGEAQTILSFLCISAGDEKCSPDVVMTLTCQPQLSAVFCSQPQTATAADAGPGLTVLDEQLSHGRDSANVRGHTVQTVPHSNQHGVLHDAMPTDTEFLHGVWSVTTFDFAQIWMEFAFACSPS